MLKKDIFRTLKHYSEGFHRSNPNEINQIYDEKVREVTERILADVNHAPEIMAEEFAKCEVLKWRRAFTEGRVPTDTYTAVWKAIDNISMALVDTTPLKK